MVGRGCAAPCGWHLESWLCAAAAWSGRGCAGQAATFCLAMASANPCSCSCSCSRSCSGPSFCSCSCCACSYSCSCFCSWHRCGPCSCSCSALCSGIPPPLVPAAQRPAAAWCPLLCRLTCPAHRLWLLLVLLQHQAPALRPAPSVQLLQRRPVQEPAPRPGLGPGLQPHPVPLRPRRSQGPAPEPQAAGPQGQQYHLQQPLAPPQHQPLPSEGPELPGWGERPGQRLQPSPGVLRAVGPQRPASPCCCCSSCRWSLGCPWPQCPRPPVPVAAAGQAAGCLAVRVAGAGAEAHPHCY